MNGSATQASSATPPLCVAAWRKWHLGNPKSLSGKGFGSRGTSAKHGGSGTDLGKSGIPETFRPTALRLSRDREGARGALPQPVPGLLYGYSSQDGHLLAETGRAWTSRLRVWPG